MHMFSPRPGIALPSPEEEPRVLSTAEAQEMIHLVPEVGGYMEGHTLDRLAAHVSLHCQRSGRLSV